MRGARLPSFGARVGPGCQGRWFSVGPVAWICEEGVVAAGAPRATTRSFTANGFPHEYFFVGKDGSLGYRALETAEEGVPEAQFLPGFGVALTRTAKKPGGDDPFGLTTHGLWVPVRDLVGPVTPPEPLAAEGSPADVAWVNVEQTTVHASPRGRRVRTLGTLSKVTVLERRGEGRDAWLRIADAEWIRARDTTSPRPATPPAEALPLERWIDVDVERQVLTAYAGERALYSMPVSTGRGKEGTELATPRGVHRLWIKLRTSDMDNLENLEAAESYAIQAVPWVMYFDRGYGLHGAFWHRAFGRVQSHGCVNLTPADAERLFEWASPRLPDGWSAVLPTDYERGTLVSVR